MSKNKRIFLTVLFIVISLLFFILAGGYTVIKTYYKLNYTESIARWADEYGLDRTLVASVIWTESRFNAKAESSAGAAGLMQIMPETGQWIAEKIDLGDYSDDMRFDPDTSIHMGCWYLRYLSDRFSETDTVLAAYNAGPNKVSEWLEDESYSDDGKTLYHIPYEETANYVKRVNQANDIYNLFYEI